MSARAENLLGRRLALLAILLVFLLPVAWLLTTAWKQSSQIFSIPPTLYFTPSLDQFRSAFAFFDIWSLVKSSLIISVGSAVLSLLLGVPAGYALARSRSRLAVGTAAVSRVTASRCDAQDRVVTSKAWCPVVVRTVSSRPRFVVRSW